MKEYRIQTFYNGSWHFITDGHGKYYTYKNLETAKRNGLSHGRNNWNGRDWVIEPGSFRIVSAEIDWAVEYEA